MIKVLVPVLVVGILAMSALFAYLIHKASERNYAKIEELRDRANRSAKLGNLRTTALANTGASLTTHLSPTHPAVIDFNNTMALLSEAERKVIHPDEA